MEFTFDLAGARRAAEAGRLAEWLQGKVLREGRANRPLAAILRGQRPLLSGPTMVPIAGLERIAGGEPHFKYPVPMAQWEREIAPMMEVPLEGQPPVLLTLRAARVGRQPPDRRLGAARRDARPGDRLGGLRPDVARSGGRPSRPRSPRRSRRAAIGSWPFRRAGSWGRSSWRRSSAG